MNCDDKKFLNIFNDVIALAKDFFAILRLFFNFLLDSPTHSLLVNSYFFCNLREKKKTQDEESSDNKLCFSSFRDSKDNLLERLATFLRNHRCSYAISPWKQQLLRIPVFFGYATPNERWANRPDSHGNSVAHRNSFRSLNAQSINLKKVRRRRWNLGKFWVCFIQHDCRVQSAYQPLVISNTFSIEAIFVYKQKLKTETRKPRIQKDFKTFSAFFSTLSFIESETTKKFCGSYGNLFILFSYSYPC